MPILVQKFGGTSVSTPERRQQVVDKIAGAKKGGYSPVVVVSAPGRCGESYATDTLLNLARQECPSIDGRELDMIMACGEIVGGVIIVGALKNAGFDAVLLNGQQAGIMTTGNHGDAQIVQIKSANVLNYVSQGKIVVVAGFQGANEIGEVTTLGRGGSDTSAAALGAAIDAAAVEIYTDVNGIMTADPRIVPAATTIECASYEEVYRLALHGAKVIHPRAVEVAWRHNVHLKVKCTFTDEAGTTISNSPNDTIERLRDSTIVGVAHQGDYGIFTLADISSANYESAGRLLGKLVDAHISVDCANVSQCTMEFAASSAVIDKIASISRDLGLGPTEILCDCAKISLIGRFTYDAVSLMSTFTNVLQCENIKILRVFNDQCAVSGVVGKDDVIPAIKALHKKLFEK
jgi:aspartate kinase